jgi:hypothetical protein
MVVSAFSQWLKELFEIWASACMLLHGCRMYVDWREEMCQTPTQVQKLKETQIFYSY